MTWRDLTPFALLSVAWVLLAYTILVLTPRALYSDHRTVLLGVLTCTGAPLVVWAVELMVGQLGRRRRSHQLARRLTHLHGETAQRVAQRLQRAAYALSDEHIAAERDRLRRSLAKADPQSRQRAEWIRLLTLEGPNSTAWRGLAEVLRVGSEVDLCVLAGAEARRCDHATADEYLTLCEELLPSGSDVWHLAERHHPAALAVLSLGAEGCSAAELSRLYRLLSAAGLPRSVELVLWREVLLVTADKEEAALQAKRLRGPVEPDPTLANFVAEAWHRAAHELGLESDVLRAGLDEPEEWLEQVPAVWRAALGLASRAESDVAVRYHEPVPMYALRGQDTAGEVADHIARLIGEPRDLQLTEDLVPGAIAEWLRGRLWPRRVRSRSTIATALASLGTIKSAAHQVAGLEEVAAALGEETDPRLSDLREDLERQARLVADPESRVRALHAAGRAWWPAQPTKGLALWQAAEDGLSAVEGPVRRRLYAALGTDWLSQSRVSDGGPNEHAALTMAVRAALQSRDAALIEQALLSLTASAGDDPWKAQQEQLAGMSSTYPARLLVAWRERDWTTVVDCTKALLQRDTEAWAWLGYALARVARPGDEVLLRPLLEPLRRLSTGAATVGPWLALAYTVERLAGRAGLPEATRALQALVALSNSDLLSALAGLRFTLRHPESRWLDTVEATLARRVVGHRGGGRNVGDAELLKRIEAIAAVLPPARLRALLDRWMARWSAEWTAFSRSLWSADRG